MGTLSTLLIKSTLTNQEYPALKTSPYVIIVGTLLWPKVLFYFYLLLLLVVTYESLQTVKVPLAAIVVQGHLE